MKGRHFVLDIKIGLPSICICGHKCKCEEKEDRHAKKWLCEIWIFLEEFLLENPDFAQLFFTYLSFLLAVEL